VWGLVSSIIIFIKGGFVLFVMANNRRGVSPKVYSCLLYRDDTTVAEAYRCPKLNGEMCSAYKTGEVKCPAMVSSEGQEFLRLELEDSEKRW